MSVFRRFGRCNHGATLVEFGLVTLPIMFFILGLMQTGYIVWVYNLLQTSVDTAARCGAVNSITAPCAGRTQMVSTAQQVFLPLTGAGYTVICSGGGLVGTYSVTIVFVANLTITAQSCYPTIPTPS